MKKPNWEKEFGMMVRDFTAIGFMAKSEAKTRFKKIIEKELKSQQADIKKMIEGKLRFRDGRSTKLDLFLEMRIEDLKRTGKSTMDVEAGYNQALSDILKEIE